MRRLWAVGALVLVPVAAAADVTLTAGFSAEVYVTGDGFDPAAARGVREIRSTSTLAVDHAGFLYLARTGRRYFGGEIDDLWPLYRVPLRSASVGPSTSSITSVHRATGPLMVPIVPLRPQRLQASAG